MPLEFTGTVLNGVVVVESGANLPEGSTVRVVVEPTRDLSERLARFKGIGKDLPTDLAENHDHYLHGTPKR